MSETEPQTPDGLAPEPSAASGWREPVWLEMEPPPPERPKYWLHGLLLFLTLVTTTIVGAEHWLSFEANYSPHLPPFTWMSLPVHGLWYALTILAILGAHEAGHYFACRYYGVDATLPYFLPIPFPLTGTAGAFIKIRSHISSKRVLFDVGVAGPIAGFIVTIPALVAGVWMSRLVPLPHDFVGMELGEPLLFQAVVRMVWGDVPDGLSLNLHPMAFAAWFGMLATALNLIPIGQFDGGHVAYAMFGRRASWITLGAVATAIGLSVYSSSWIVWTVIAVFLLYKFGWRHPRTWDEDFPLDPTRRWVALVALLIFIACFTAAPISPFELVGAR